MECRHETDDELELYALGRLTEPRVAEVEEHLLICALCQDRLDEVEMFAVAMREAIAGEPLPEARAGWSERLGFTGSGLTEFRLRLTNFSQPALASAAGFAAITLVAGLLHHSGQHVAPLASIELMAMRGDIPAVAPALETDITLADAPAETALRAEIVDSRGGMVWSGECGSDGHQIRVNQVLVPGTYFVRLTDEGGKLLHEYGFRVRAPV